MPAPLRPGAPGATAPITPTAPAAPAAPTAPAAASGPTAWGGPAGPAPFDAFAARAGASLGSALSGVGRDDYALLAGRAPGAVALPQLLAQLGATPEGRAAAGQLLEAFKAKTGVAVPPEVLSAVLSNPQALTTALELTPAQLSEGVSALNAAYQAGRVKDVAPRADLLPQHFDLAKLDALSLPRPEAKLEQLAPGLYTGDLPSALPDAQVQRNRAMAEVFQRLAGNASRPAAQRFEVKYGGHTFTRLDTFVGALEKDGYQVNVSFESRVANFAALHTPVPGSNPPGYADVPAPLMVRTGLKDAQGREAVVPAAHSEMIVSLKAGPHTRGPRFDADLKYYQGTTGTGFFPAHTFAEPAWLGRVVHAQVSGAQAARAVALAGAFTDVVDASAKAQHLYADGYGVTGVCNDSVAVVEQALLGHAEEYPLLMKDEVLFGELKKRLADADHRDDPDYRALEAAIRALPSDAQPNASQRARALASLPWAAGAEPFASSAEARRILSE